MHTIEERLEVGHRKINLSLSPLNVLEPDLVLEVDATDGRWRDHHLTERSVEHLCTLHQRQMS